MANAGWTKQEVDLIIPVYFEMLSLELAHRRYNKSEFRNSLLVLLPNRSEGSIEFKHQNISAVLASMGLPFISGYKPRNNFQQILLDEVANYLQLHKNEYETKFDHFATQTSTPIDYSIDFDLIIGEGPIPSSVEEREPSYKPIKINYLQKEQNNRSLGEKGEKLVIEYERFRLIKEGKESLADKIEWVSNEKGDGAGFDVLSKNNNGTDRYIEVKTTKLSKETPIYLSKNEVSFAALKKEEFFLYRVYNFDKKPQIFIKQGEYDSFCRLRVESYKGYF